MQMYKNLSGTRSIGSSSAPVRSAGVSVPRGRRSAVMVEARKVAVLGAGGGIGQPLSLLLKMNKCITDLSLYDIGGVQGVAADISHCNTPVKVGAYNGQEELASAIKNADVIIIPAGVPRKPGMTRDDLFNVNAGIVKSLVETIATECPGAIIQLVTNPVNSTVPIAAEVMKKKGVHDARKIMGVTTLDVVRANTFVSEARNLDVKDVDVPVVGGHAGATILPLLSQVTPPVSFSDEEKKAMTEKIQNAGTVVVEAKAGKGSATLSMAYAAARMAESTLLGLNGEPSIYECSYVESSVVPDCPFFASKVLLGPEGVSKVFELGSMDAVEQAGMEAMLPELKASIQKGIAFANAQ